MRQLNRVPMAIVVAALSVATPLGAETPAEPADPVAALVGARLRVARTAESSTLTGTLAGYRAGVLSITRDGSSEATLVPRADVTRLWVARGRQSMWRKGAGIGGTVGAVLGAIPAMACAAKYRACADDRMTGALAAPLVVGAAGAALGAVVGAPFLGERWEDAAPPKASLRALPVKGGVGVAVAIPIPPRGNDR